AWASPAERAAARSDDESRRREITRSPRRESPSSAATPRAADARGRIRRARGNLRPPWRTRRTSFPAVDGDHLAADPASVLGREEQHAVGDVVRRARTLERDPIDERAVPPRRTRPTAFRW